MTMGTFVVPTKFLTKRQIEAKLPVVIEIGGKKPSKGEYIEVLQWTQGRIRIRRNLITGGTRYQKNSRMSRRKPWDTLRIVSVSRVKPKPQRIDLGPVKLRVSGKRLSYTLPPAIKVTRTRSIKTPRLRGRRI